MKFKIFTLAALLCATMAWGQVTPEKAAQMRTDDEMEFFNLESVRSAYKDFCKNSSYDAATYGAKLKELEQMCANSNAKAEDVVKLKREILLSNPLLDNAKIIVGRYTWRKTIKIKKRIQLHAGAACRHTWRFPSVHQQVGVGYRISRN